MWRVFENDGAKDARAHFLVEKRCAEVEAWLSEKDGVLG